MLPPPPPSLSLRHAFQIVCTSSDRFRDVDEQSVIRSCEKAHEWRNALLLAYDSSVSVDLCALAQSSNDIDQNLRD